VSDIVPAVTTALELLNTVAPLVPKLFPDIVVAVESKDETLARRLLQEALERQAFRAARIAKSAKAPSRRRPAS
jgi:hypothetical protein